MTTRFCALALGGALLSSVFCGAAVVHAQSTATDPAKTRAEELFRTGKAQMANGEFAKACPQLAESYALAPATGCLLALAVCRQGEGKLASAYRAYAEVVTRARVAGQTEREQAARKKLDDLLPQLSTLTLRAPLDTPAGSLRVRLNGEPVSSSQLDVPFPVDGGVLNLEVEKAGREPWRSAVTMAPRGEAKRVDIPSLRPAPVVAAPVAAHPAVLPSAPVARALADTPSTHSSGQRFAVGLLATGGAGIATGVFFSLRQSIRKREADLDCKDACSEQGFAARNDAESARKLSILSYGIGGALAAAGVTTYFYTRPKPGSRHLAWSPWAQPQGAGLDVQGSF